MTQTNQSGTNISLLSRLGRDPTDQSAWCEFVDRYGPKIDAWCRSWRLQEADVQDVTQAVLTRLAVRMSTFAYDPSRSFRAWLRTVVHNAWRDKLAERRLEAGGEQVAALIGSLEAREDLARRLEAEFDLELLGEAQRRVRQRVAPHTWEAYWLTAVDQLSGAEVAHRLGVKIAAVFVSKRNVLRMLKDEVLALETDMSSRG